MARNPIFTIIAEISAEFYIQNDTTQRKDGAFFKNPIFGKSSCYMQPLTHTLIKQNRKFESYNIHMNITPIEADYKLEKVVGRSERMRILVSKE